MRGPRLTEIMLTYFARDQVAAQIDVPPAVRKTAAPVLERLRSVKPPWRDAATRWYPAPRVRNAPRARVPVRRTDISRQARCHSEAARNTHAHGPKHSEARHARRVSQPPEMESSPSSRPVWAGVDRPCSDARSTAPTRLRGD